MYLNYARRPRQTDIGKENTGREFMFKVSTLALVNKKSNLICYVLQKIYSACYSESPGYQIVDGF
jgi:hypothetical protein